MNKHHKFSRHHGLHLWLPMTPIDERNLDLTAFLREKCPEFHAGSSWTMGF
jgi:hypothetical protein